MTLASPADVHVTPEAANAPARSRAATRRRLLDSAIALFSARGLHAVTSHEIARGAGVATGTFYLHFRDKTEIHREICFQALARLREELQRRVAEAATPDAILEARIRAVVEFAAANHAIVRILFSRDSEADDVENDVLEDIARAMSSRLREEQAAGVFAPDLDPDLATQAILGMTSRLIDWWTQDPSRADAEKLIATLVRLQRSGAAPRTD
jgi:AcrR family transcriptional regulator